MYVPRQARKCETIWEVNRHKSVLLEVLLRKMLKTNQFVFRITILIRVMNHYHPTVCQIRRSVRTISDNFIVYLGSIVVIALKSERSEP